MKILRIPMAIALLIIGTMLVLGGYLLGHSAQRNATAMAVNMDQSNTKKISSLEAQKAKLQSDENNLQTQLTQARKANDLLQEELVDRPTIIAPGTVKDLDGDEK